jgi:hypothetical protein
MQLEDDPFNQCSDIAIYGQIVNGDDSIPVFREQRKNVLSARNITVIGNRASGSFDYTDLLNPATNQILFGGNTRSGITDLYSNQNIKGQKTFIDNVFFGNATKPIDQYQVFNKKAGQQAIYDLREAGISQAKITLTTNNDLVISAGNASITLDRKTGKVTMT